MLAAGLSYLAFTLTALVLPGVALLRALRLKIDAALVLPLGFGACACAWWLSLVTHTPWLFPILIGGLDATLLLRREPWTRAEGPGLLGVVPPLLATVVVFALLEYPLNRLGPRGEFVFDPLVPEDTTFHAALAWDLTTHYPPDVPGLSNVPMGYHNGLPLVRAAAVRWAGVVPYDQISRFEITLAALAMMIGLRSLAWRLGGGPLAVALVPWTLLLTDFSFFFGANPYAEMWLNLTDSNLLFSLAHANSSVLAILMAFGSLLALVRHRAGEGRGWFWVAAALSLAVPHFKAFVAAQYLFGLGVAALLTLRFAEPILLGLPAALGLLSVVVGRASAHMEVLVDPLTIANKLRHGLSFPPVSGASLLVWAVLWLVASLGLRLVGLPSAIRALRSKQPLAIAVAAMALVGWPIGLIFRITPVDAPGRPPYNEAWYFIEQSAPLLWVFAVLAFAGLGLAGRRLWAGLAVGAALSLPSTLQFIAAKRALATVNAPPAVVAAMAALEKATQPGEVVLQRPEPKRFPPPPMVLIGRRVPYTRFIPYLYQVAPQDELKQRIEQVRRFFKTTDPKEAVAVARSLGARYVVLYAGDEVAFPTEGVLEPVFEEPNAKLYEIVGP